MKTRTLFLLIMMAILARDIYRNCQTNSGVKHGTEN